MVSTRSTAVEHHRIPNSRSTTRSNPSHSAMYSPSRRSDTYRRHRALRLAGCPSGRHANPASPESGLGSKARRHLQAGQQLQRQRRGPPGADGASGVSRRFDFERLVELCRRTHDETRRSAARAVDRSLVVRNWLFGWYIVEYEQSGADRAEYGVRLLARMSDRLRQMGIRGASTTRLKLYRQFYRQRGLIGPTVSDQSLLPALSEETDRIRPTPSDQFRHPRSAFLAQITARLRGEFPLGWSHYVILLSVSDPEARRFYEIEAAGNTSTAT